MVHLDAVGKQTAKCTMNHRVIPAVTDQPSDLSVRRRCQLAPSVTGGLCGGDGIVRYSIGPHRVKRRFSDFLALHESVSGSYLDSSCAAMLPVLPPKTAWNSTSNAFIRERAAQLDIYLQQLCVLPGACLLPVLRSFVNEIDFDVDAEPSAVQALGSCNLA